MLALLLTPLTAAADIAEPAAQLAPDDQREALVLRARQGQSADALVGLDALLERYPEDRQLRIDAAVVAAWAGADAHTLDLLQPLERAGLPEYALRQLSRSARNLGRWELALAGYEALIARDPTELDAHLGYLLSLADAGRFDAARAAVPAAAAAAGTPSEQARVAAGCGYVEERARRFTAALGCYNRALALDPDNRDAARRRILVSSALGAADAALALARAHPDLLDSGELLRLELDAVAMQIRWAELPQAPAPDGRSSSAAELPELQARLAAAHPELTRGLDTPAARAFQFDRVAALVAASRMAEAVALFESLEQAASADLEIPDYAWSAAGRAYLYQEQPEQAERCFRAALAARPESFAAKVGLFYALSDQNRARDASTVADELLAAEPAWLRPTPGLWRENPDYAEARQIAAMELAYRDRYGAALSELDEMLAIAPADSGTRIARAQVLNWRGWHGRAATELAIAALADPGNPRAAIVGANVALDAQRYDRAESLLAQALATAPLDKATQELEQRWQLHNSPELVLEAQAERAAGSAFSGDSWRSDARYLSAPVRRHYRVYAHDLIRTGEFIEGSARDHRLGVGLEYRGHAITTRGELYRGLEQNDETGAAISLDWRLGDHLTVAAGAAANSVEVPLRALRAGISGDSADVSVSYRWNEARAAGARMSMVEFDDDNRRTALGVDYQWRVVNAPRHKLLADVSGYASRNSSDDRPYFNPERDASISLGLTHEWRLWRRYDHGLTQRAGIEAGNYWQRDFGSGIVWTLRVEQAWSLGARWELSYGASSGGRLYDGDREHAHSLYLGLRGRL
ncbi:MAG: poly-beta-1,6 N-acetyl-D-glucosamine export porin PgaA [Pseudomonadales bacterium]